MEIREYRMVGYKSLFVNGSIKSFVGNVEAVIWNELALCQVYNHIIFLNDFAKYIIVIIYYLDKWFVFCYWETQLIF